MISFPLFGENAQADSPFKKIIDGAQGVILILDSAPTTAGNQLPKHSDCGFFGNDLYINLNGTTVKFTGTAV